MRGSHFPFDIFESSFLFAFVSFDAHGTWSGVKRLERWSCDGLGSVNLLIFEKVEVFF